MLLKEVQNSSAISKIGYNSNDKDLFIVTKNNHFVYAYHNVSEETFNAFEKAESKGSFFINNIKGHYEFDKKAL